MKCVEELSPETLFDLDEIEALPSFDVPDFMPDVPAIAFGFAEAETSSATTCTVSVTLVAENPYDGVFCFAQYPFGLFEANSSHDYWMSAAVSGQDAGGILGNLQTAGAATMTSFIDFFASRSVENLYATSGSAAGVGQTGKAWGYGALGGGQILLSASAGWTGGGGAAAKGVKFSGLGWYEVGSQTIRGSVFKELGHLDKVALGKELVSRYGWKETLLHMNELRPGLADWLKTLSQGPTPGGYILLQWARIFGPKGLEAAWNKGGCE